MVFFLFQVHVTSTRSLQELNQSQSGYRLQKKHPEMPRKNKENAPPSAQKAEEMDDFHAGSSQSSDQGNSPLRGNPSKAKTDFIFQCCDAGRAVVQLVDALKY
ncbi:hypothetical protein DPMN_018359 [Dreissena polymorpha]|uniref:Uncharacterized protein n=1 Tax=Dreissena polymorpha TaxID=45954 RepID=A0A9D4ND23_DREPO|nr:hypothetical protein DPMN_018359 [Dreissena polymorpha]